MIIASECLGKGLSGGSHSKSQEILLGPLEWLIFGEMYPFLLAIIWDSLFSDTALRTPEHPKPGWDVHLPCFIHLQVASDSHVHGEAGG